MGFENFEGTYRNKNEDGTFFGNVQKSVTLILIVATQKN
jgi:hypothetical protein